MNNQTLENYVQLHESIEIIYVVDGYLARLMSCDGNRTVASRKGETIAEALSKLEKYVQENYRDVYHMRQKSWKNNENDDSESID